jgi:hypothetical protein
MRVGANRGKADQIGAQLVVDPRVIGIPGYQPVGTPQG